MVMLAAAVSLRFFRFGGIQKMVLSGVGAGFLLYVLSKGTEDLSKAELMHPIASAWLPVCVGGLTGFLALLSQEAGEWPVSPPAEEASPQSGGRPACPRCHAGVSPAAEQAVSPDSRSFS